MSYNDPFGNMFVSDADLMPVWNINDYLADPFDLFDPFCDSPSNGPIERMNPGDVLVPNNREGNGMGNGMGSGNSNFKVTAECGENTDLEFPDEWEHPLPIKCEPGDLNPVEQEDTELDNALALDNPYEAVPQTYYHSSAYTQVHQPFVAVDPYGIVEPRKIKRGRIVDDDEEDPMVDSVDPLDSTNLLDEDDPTDGFKLPASKSPIMEAMVVCALNSWGIEVFKNIRATSTAPAEVIFKVVDFNRYYKISRTICSKQRPTDDLGSRIKSLRRWFTNFPKKKDRVENSFYLQVKPAIAKKVNEIIERNSRSLGLTKRRRRQ